MLDKIVYGERIHYVKKMGNTNIKIYINHGYYIKTIRSINLMNHKVRVFYINVFVELPNLSNIIALNYRYFKRPYPFSTMHIKFGMKEFTSRSDVGTISNFKKIAIKFILNNV